MKQPPPQRKRNRRLRRSKRKRRRRLEGDMAKKKGPDIRTVEEADFIL